MVTACDFVEVFPVVALVLRTLERTGFLVVALAATDARVLLTGFTLVRDLLLRALPVSDDFAVVVRFFDADLVVGMSFSLGVRARPFFELRRLKRCGTVRLG